MTGEIIKVIKTVQNKETVLRQNLWRFCIIGAVKFRIKAGGYLTAELEPVVEPLYHGLQNHCFVSIL